MSSAVNVRAIPNISPNSTAVIDSKSAALRLAAKKLKDERFRYGTAGRNEFGC
jgi:hypothetical protein